MRVNINLASQPYEDARRFWFKWGAGIAALGIFTLALIYLAVAGWFLARRDREMIRSREAQIAVRDGQKAEAQALMNLPENTSTRDRSQFLNDLFQRKAFSWTKAFEDLERLMPPRLHVVSIQPEMSADNQLQIKFVVAGESRERALELVRHMEGSQRFQQTQIERESFSTQGASEVHFDITALYVPESEMQARPAIHVNAARKGGF